MNLNDCNHESEFNEIYKFTFDDWKTTPTGRMVNGNY